MKPYIKPLLLGVIGLVFLSFGLGIVISGWGIIPKFYYYFNPPVYNSPPDTTKINSEKLLTLINQERQSKGLKPFQKSQTLTYIAYLRAKNIIDTQEFTHEATRSGLSYDKLAIKIGYFYKSLRENLAIGYETEERIIEDWKRSEKHAKNIFTNEELDAGIYSQEGVFYGDKRVVTVLILGRDH